MFGLTPDDVAETEALMDELADWIEERTMRADPALMSFLLLIYGARIAEMHKKEGVVLWGFFDDAINLGVQWGFDDVRN